MVFFICPPFTVKKEWWAQKRAYPASFWWIASANPPYNLPAVRPFIYAFAAVYNETRWRVAEFRSGNSFVVARHFGI
jgi:hypothetical protein